MTSAAYPSELSGNHRKKREMLNVSACGTRLELDSDYLQSVAGGIQMKGMASRKRRELRNKFQKMAKC